MQRASTILLAWALALALVIGGLLWRMGEQTAWDDNSAAIGGPFALTDQDGRPRTDKDFHGHWVLLYFGYTYCPDVCPTTLAAMATALDRLGARSARIVPVFITVDPERDSPDKLKKYLAAFGPRFVGLTGTPAAIAKAAHAYRVYYARHSLAGGGYTVDHSSVIYLLDPDGKFVKVYADETAPATIADDLKARL